MVAVKNSDPLVIFRKVMCNFFTDNEESFERRSLVIFPFIALDILQYRLVYFSTTDVNGQIFIVVVLF